MKSGSLFVRSSTFWVYGYDPETKSFRGFPYNENPTKALSTTSLKCGLPSTDAINTHVYEGSRSLHARSASFKSTRFSQNNKFGYLSNRTRGLGVKGLSQSNYIVGKIDRLCRNMEICKWKWMILVGTLRWMNNADFENKVSKWYFTYRGLFFRLQWVHEVFHCTSDE